jgi:hypothetical protein
MRNQNYEHPETTFLESFYKNSDGRHINLRLPPLGQTSFVTLSEIDTVPTISKTYKAQSAQFRVVTGEVRT